MTNDLILSSSPHVRTREDIPWIMRQVIIALIPGALLGLYFFGVPALNVIFISLVSCVFIEALCQKIMRRPVTVWDGSAVVTGLLLAMNMPAGAPWWIVVLGSFIAIVLGKQVYGGLGNNPFNPVLVARVFLQVSFPVHMTSWIQPGAVPMGMADTVTGATPLGTLKTTKIGYGNIDMLNIGWFDQANVLNPFLGNVGGCIGEISALALLIGGIYLIARKVITWHIPVFYIGTVFVLTGIFWAIDPHLYANPLYHIVTGGLFIGAFFMATDMVTSPITNKGKCIFAIGCGVIVVAIRLWGAYPEGVSFSILIMNAFVPLINRMTKPKKLGVVK